MHTKRDPYICKRDLKKRPISIKRDRQKDSDIHEKRPTNKNYIQKKRQTKETDIHEKKGILTAKVEPFKRHP